MNQKLIVLDLDGTILNTHTTIHPYTKKVILAVKELGHVVVLATGRPWRATEKFYDELKLDTPVINYNGALIHHPGNPQFKKKIITVPKAFVYALEATLQDYIENILCEIEDDVYLQKHDEIIDGFFWRDAATSVQLGSMHDLLSNDPCTVVVQLKHIEDQNRLIMFMQHYPSLIYRFWGGKYDQFVEIFSPNVDKANGIEHVNQIFQINPDNYLIMGDANNDLGMLQMGGHSVAMSNGTDRAKEVATEISHFSNIEGGVGHFLNRFFRLNIPYEE